MRRQVFICSECGRAIREGDSVLHYLGEQLCAKCVKKLTEKAVKVDEPDGRELLRQGQWP